MIKTWNQCVCVCVSIISKVNTCIIRFLIQLEIHENLIQIDSLFPRDCHITRGIHKSKASYWSEYQNWFVFNGFQRNTVTVEVYTINDIYPTCLLLFIITSCAWTDALAIPLNYLGQHPHPTPYKATLKHSSSVSKKK